MKVLKEANRLSLSLLDGNQFKTEGKKYRWNKFCLTKKWKDEYIIYCSMSGCVLLLTNYEYKNVFNNKLEKLNNILISNYFLVPENYNEVEIINTVRERLQIPITDNYLDHPSHFTILTTTMCNARCSYCYEKNAEHKHHMTSETAEKVADYIIKYSNRKKVELGWFGGEPLFNNKVIDIITTRLDNAGLSFTSSMVSNGYLFTDKIVEKAINNWNLKHVLITLDGTELNYNRIKNYIYEEDLSPFNTVINNIEKLMSHNIGVSIRMNLDLANADDLILLVHKLGNKFKDNKLFSMYAHEIFEYDGLVRTPDERKAVYEKMKEICKVLYSYGYSIMGKDLGRDIKGRHCMIDSGDGVIISPDGELGLCEHYIDSRFFANIDNPIEKDFNEIKSWRNTIPYTDKCYECPLFPICFRAPGCPDEIPCDEYYRDYIIDSYYNKMDLIAEEFSKNPTSCLNNCRCLDNKCLMNRNLDPNKQYLRVINDGGNIKIEQIQ